MIKILCLLHIAKFNVKNMAFMLLRDLKRTNEKRVVAPNLTREDPRIILLV